MARRSGAAVWGVGVCGRGRRCYSSALACLLLCVLEKLRTAMGSFADSWKKGSWHPYRMPLPVLRATVRTVGIAGAALFFYIAYVALTR